MTDVRGFSGTGLALLAMLAGCADRPPADVPLAACHELVSGGGTDQFDFLNETVGDARIVQLGENTHGVEDYNRLKADMVRALHQTAGFDVIVFESSVYQCDEVDRNLATRPPDNSLYMCAFGVWHTPTLIELFDYIAQSQNTDRPIRLAGFDIQPIGPNKDGRPAFLASQVGNIVPERREEMEALDQAFLANYATGSRERRNFYRSDEGARMARDYDAFSDLLAAAGDGGRDRLIARMTLRSMAAYIRQQSAPDMAEYAERRDRGMAENLIDLATGLYPDDKMIVWAHNAHIRHANEQIEPHEDVFPGIRVRLAGSDVRDRFADEVYTVGLYAARGQAKDNRGQVFDIAEPDAGSLEARVSAIPGAAAFIDLDRAAGMPSLSWTSRPVTARFDARTPQMMILNAQYDAVVVVDSASPRLTRDDPRPDPLPRAPLAPCDLTSLD